MKNIKGMSIVGVLTAVGISSIAVLGTLAVFNNQLLGQKFVEQKYGVVYLNNEVYQILSSPNACTQTFNSLSSFNYLLPTSDSVFDTIKQIKNSNGTVVYRTFDDPDPATSPSKFYENNSLQIKKIKLEKYTPNDTPTGPTDPLFYVGTASLNVEYDRVSIGFGPRSFNRTIKLEVELKKCSDCTVQPSLTCEVACSGATQAAKEAQNRTIKTCRSFGGGSGDSFWTLTGAGDGIYYTQKVGVGTNSPTLNLEVVSEGGSQTAIAAVTHGNTSGGGFLTRTSRGSKTSPLAVQNGDTLGVFTAQGYGATGWSSFGRARVQMIATENWNDTQQGAALLFETTANGTVAGSTERMRINHDGNVGIGLANPTSKLDVAGGIRPGNQTQVTTCAAAADEGILRYNTALHLMEFCSFEGGAYTWKASAGSIRFRVYRNGAQSISSGVSTSLDFNNESFDSHNAYNLVTNQFIAPTNGVYFFNARVSMNNVYTGTPNQFNFELYKNGSLQAQGPVQVGYPGYTDYATTLNSTLSLVSGDIIQIRLTHDAGSAKSTACDSTSCYFEGYLL